MTCHPERLHQGSQGADSGQSPLQAASVRGADSEEDEINVPMTLGVFIGTKELTLRVDGINELKAICAFKKKKKKKRVDHPF